MREKDIIENLQREIIIPDIVQAKADQVFRKPPVAEIAQR